MKKIILLTAAIAMSALLAVPAMARLKESRHNLSASGDYNYRTDNISQICVFCHTPHNPVQNVPLWNRSAGQAANTYLMYTASASISQRATGLASDSISLFCLSCHNGVNGLWALVKNQGTTDQGVTATGSNLSITATRTNIGANQNLTNDHPVNIRISGARVGDTDNWRDDTYITGTGGLRLFRSAGDQTGGGGQGVDFVECPSCHDPHKTDNKKFLRKNNASSSLCLTCHNK